MPMFGQFEIRAPFAIGECSVSVAVHEGSDRYVVKALEIDDTIEDREVLRVRIDRFLERAGAMAQLSQSRKASNWIEILDSGRSPAGAYYATRRYPNSLRKIISGRSSLNAQQMHHVIGGVFKGMCQIRDELGRAHGAVKPENVLLDQPGIVTKARVLLADPAPGDRADEAEDVRALGRLVYELVFFAEFRLPGGYPVEDDKAWQRLGESSQGWRSLCNRVLDPDAQPTSLTIDSIADDIRTLGSGRRTGGGFRVPRGVLIGGTASIALIGGGAGLYFSGAMTGQTGGSEPAATPDDGNGAAAADASAMWRRWCLSAQWVLDLGRPETASRLEEDQHLRETLGSIDFQRLDPRFVANSAITDLARLAESPPPDIDQGAVRAALESIDRIVRGFEDWPLVQQTERHAAAMASVGWGRASDIVRDWIRSVDPSGLDGSDASELIAASGALIEHRETIRLLADHAEKADASLDRLIEQGAEPHEQLGRFISATPDAINTGAQASGGAVLVAIENAARERVQLLDSLVGLIDDRYGGRVPDRVREAFTREASARGLDPTRMLYFQTYGEVLRNPPSETVQRVRDPDPEWAAGLAARLEELQERLDRARSREGIRPEEDADLEEAARALAETRRDAENLPQLDGPGDVERLVEARGEIDSRLARVGSMVAETIARVDERSRSDVDLLRSIIQAESIVPAGTPMPELFDEAWRERRDAIEAEAGGEVSVARDMRDSLADLFSRTVAALDISPAIPEGLTRIDAAELRRIAFERRRSAARDLLDSLPRTPPTQGWSMIEPESHEIVLGYRSWVERANSALEAAARIERAVDLGYALEEPAVNGQTIRTRWEALKDEPDMGELVASMDDLASLIQQIEVARQIETWSAALTRIEEQDALPIALAAWRSLGSARPPTPSRAVLDDLSDAHGRLRAGLARLRDQARAQVLLSELERQWQNLGAQLLELATGPDQFELIANRLAEWQIDPLAQSFEGNLSDAARYNLLVHGLAMDLSAMGAAGPEPGVVAQRVERFIRASEALDVEVGPEARAWVTRIGTLHQANSVDPSDLARAGPGGTGWTLDRSAQDRVVFTGPTGQEESQRIEFARVPGVGGTDRAVYMSTAEVSLGLFDAVASWADAWDDLSSRWNELRSARQDPSGTTNQRWPNIRGWRWDPRAHEGAGGLVPAGRWLANTIGNPDLERAVYPESIAPQPTPPTTDSPIQRITPEAASELATRIGCRLPSFQEWQAAHQSEVQAGESRWNLRGPESDVWWAHTQHINTGWPLDEPETSYYIHANAFTPGSGSLRGDIPTDPGDARADEASEDGTLIFDEIRTVRDRGVVFRHIVGNVAEFVTSEPQPGAADEYRVIGRSALSSPAMLSDEPYPLRPMMRFRHADDVGFRLAFEVEARPADLATRIGELVARHRDAYVF